MNWIQVTSTGNIPLREGRAVKLGDCELAVFNLGDKFLAVDNRCPHRGGPLADGIVAGETVVCPLHAWKVCLQTGTALVPGGESPCVRTYPVQVKDGMILIRLPGETTEAA